MGKMCGSACCGPAAVKYDFEGKTHSIDHKNASTIERFG